jgi:hypothetical protein
MRQKLIEMLIQPTVMKHTDKERFQPVMDLLLAEVQHRVAAMKSASLESFDAELHDVIRSLSVLMAAMRWNDGSHVGGAETHVKLVSELLALDSVNSF